MYIGYYGIDDLGLALHDALHRLQHATIIVACSNLPGKIELSVSTKYQCSA